MRICYNNTCRKPGKVIETMKFHAHTKREMSSKEVFYLLELFFNLIMTLKYRSGFFVFNSVSMQHKILDEFLHTIFVGASELRSKGRKK